MDEKLKAELVGYHGEEIVPMIKLLEINAEIIKYEERFGDSSVSRAAQTKLGKSMTHGTMTPEDIARHIEDKFTPISRGYKGILTILRSPPK